MGAYNLERHAASWGTPCQAGRLARGSLRVLICDMDISSNTAEASCRVGPIRASFAPDMDRYDVSGVEKRRHEFLTGRSLAENALCHMGCSDPFVGRHPDRSPIWPAGFCGSISHSDRLCTVMVGKTSALRSIGVDIEPQGAVPDGLRDTIYGPGDDPDGADPTLIFAAKEAFYKMWYPLTGVFLDFPDVGISVLGTQVKARLLTRTAPVPQLQQIHGCVSHCQGHIMVVFALEQAPGAQIRLYDQVSALCQTANAPPRDGKDKPPAAPGAHWITR